MRGQTRPFVYTGHMFATIGHTFELMKMSWRVFLLDRELVFFPIMGIIGMVAVMAIFGVIANATGSLERLNDLGAEAAADVAIGPGGGDYILLLLGYVSVYFVIIFFNAALVSAALERLRGGDPNVGSGLRHAARHIGPIFGWAVISGTVGLILMLLKSRQGTFGRIVISIIGGVWELITFFVVPILVTENVGPFTAIKRSKDLLGKTWGRQFTASFGFMLVYIAAAIIGVIPAFIAYQITPIAGIAVGFVTVGFAIGAVMALEGIFKAALYEYARGEVPLGFEKKVLAQAYRPDIREYQA